MRAESIGGDPAQAVNGPTDGQPCERVAVDIRYTRRSFFAGIIGMDRTKLTTRSPGHGDSAGARRLAGCPGGLAPAS